MSWACGACTYINVAARTTCEICGTSAPHASAQRRPAPTPSGAEGVQVVCGGCTSRLLIPATALSFICPHCRTTTQRAATTSRLPPAPQPTAVRPPASLPSARPLPFQPPRLTVAPPTQPRPTLVTPSSFQPSGGIISQQVQTAMPPSYASVQIARPPSQAIRPLPTALPVPSAVPSRPVNRPASRTNAVANAAVTGQNADEFDFSFSQFQENTFSQYQRLRSNLHAAHDKKMPVSELQIREFKEYQVSVAQQLAKFQTVLNNDMIKLPKIKEYKKTLFKCQAAFAKLHLDNSFLSRIKTYPDAQDMRPKTSSRATAEKKLPGKVEARPTPQLSAGRGVPSRQQPQVGRGVGQPNPPLAAGRGYAPPMSLSSFESSLAQKPAPPSTLPSSSTPAISTTSRPPMSLSAFESALPSTSSSAVPPVVVVQAPMSLSMFEQNLSPAPVSNSEQKNIINLDNNINSNNDISHVAPRTSVTDVSSSLAGFNFSGSPEQQQPPAVQQTSQPQEEQEGAGVVLHLAGDVEGESKEEQVVEGGEGEVLDEGGEEENVEEEELLTLEPCSLVPNQFQAIWTDPGCYNVTLTLKLDLSALREFAEFERVFTEPPLSSQLLASGMVGGRIKIYAYGKNAQAQAYFLFEILVEASTGVATITLKSEPQNSAECNSAFVGLIGHSLRPFNPEPV